MRQRQGGTFLRDHSIPRERSKGGRRFSPTLTKMLFDVSDAVNHNKIHLNNVSSPFPSLSL